MEHKRALVASAARSQGSVSVRKLFPADLLELADAEAAFARASAAKGPAWLRRSAAAW